MRALIAAACLTLFVLLGGPPARAEAPDPLVEALLTHQNHKVRIKAARKLADSKTPAARTALLTAAAEDDNPLVRAAAANSLRKHPSGDSINTLCGLLGDGDDFVRRTATRALKALGGPGGCPAWLRLEITGDTDDMQKRVRETITRLFTDDTRVRLTDAVPETVTSGRVRGYELKLRLERKVDRTDAGVDVRCIITQSIFDLRQRSLRGSATQRGSLSLGPKTPDSVVTDQIGACMDAISPVVHQGMADFLARSRR